MSDADALDEAPLTPKRRGRPRKAPNGAAASNVSVAAPPPPPAEEEVLTNLRGWMEQWEYEPDRAYVRLTRVSPKHIDGIACEGKMEDLYKPVDEEYISEVWGGGVYTVSAFQPVPGSFQTREVERRTVKRPGSPRAIPGADPRKPQLLPAARSDRFLPVGERMRDEEESRSRGRDDDDDDDEHEEEEEEVVPSRRLQPPYRPAAWRDPNQRPALDPHGHMAGRPYLPGGSYPGGGPNGMPMYGYGRGVPPQSQQNPAEQTISLLSAVQNLRSPRDEEAMQTLKDVQKQQASEKADLQRRMDEVQAMGHAPLLAVNEQLRNALNEVHQEMARREMALTEEKQRQVKQITDAQDKAYRDQVVTQEKMHKEQLLAHTKELESLRRESSSTLDAFRRESAHALQGAQAEHVRMVEMLQSNARIEREIATSRVESTQGRWDAEKERLQQQAEIERRSVNELNTRLEQARREGQLEQVRIRDELQRQIETARSDHQRQIETARSDHQKVLDALRAEHVRTLSDLKKDAERHEDQRVDLMTAASRNEFAPQLEFIKSELQRSREEASREREEVIRLRDELTDARENALIRKDPTTQVQEVMGLMAMVKQISGDSAPATPQDDSTIGKIMSALPAIKDNLIDPIVGPFGQMAQIAKQEQLRQAALGQAQQQQRQEAMAHQAQAAARMARMPIQPRTQAPVALPAPRPSPLTPTPDRAAPTRPYQVVGTRPRRAQAQQAPIPVVPQQQQPQQQPQQVMEAVPEAPVGLAMEEPVTLAPVPGASGSEAELVQKLIEYLEGAVLSDISIEDAINQIQLGVKGGYVDGALVHGLVTSDHKEVVNQLQALALEYGQPTLPSPKGEEFLYSLLAGLKPLFV